MRWARFEGDFNTRSIRVSTALKPRGPGQHREAGEQGFDAGRAGALEAAGDLFGGGLAHVLQGGADGGDLFGQGLGPGGLGGGVLGADVERGLLRP
ncbi:MAG: hypothetical protein R3D60_13200 [Paracoccaceae bacterium]